MLRPAARRGADRVHLGDAAGGAVAGGDRGTAWPRSAATGIARGRDRRQSRDAGLAAPCPLCEGRRSDRAPRAVARVARAFPALPLRALPALRRRAARPARAARWSAGCSAGPDATGEPVGDAARPVAPRDPPRRLRPPIDGPRALDALAPSGVRLLVFARQGGRGQDDRRRRDRARGWRGLRPRARVLLLSADPAHSLGDVLDADGRATTSGASRARRRSARARAGRRAGLRRTRERYRARWRRRSTRCCGGSRLRRRLRPRGPARADGPGPAGHRRAVRHALGRSRRCSSVSRPRPGGPRHGADRSRAAPARDAGRRAGLGPGPAGHPAEVPGGRGAR